MMVTPEMVRVEMDYRLEQALAGTELEHVRVARSQQRSWWRRALRHQNGEPSVTVNQVRPAA
jgi:hypothetical protein